MRKKSLSAATRIDVAIAASVLFAKIDRFQPH